MSMEYIRETYGVPAKKGGRVAFYDDGVVKYGVITGTHNAHLKIKLDGEQRAGCYHPTWNLEYLEVQS